MAYKVVDIYRDLPRTNCGDCGKGSCFAFATAVYLEAFPLERCPHLEAAWRADMEAKLEQSREAGAGRRPSSSEQALRSLLSELADADFAGLAAASGAEHELGADEGLIVGFLDGEYRVTRAGVTAVAGDPPSVWVKILILIYLTRAGGRLVEGEWIGYRDLPNTVSKAQSFEMSAARIAGEFAGRAATMAATVTAMGGRALEPGPADEAYRVEVLPRVPMLLLFWREEEEFPARVSLLLDRSVLDYLDQEALVFAAEALAGRLLGEDLSELVG
ncbi:MAG: DUF3786 domain-containing protein [Thermoleophilia bacterium]